MQLFTNNATSRFAIGISNVALSLQVQPGDGAKFPSPTGGDYFLVTLSKVNSGVESSIEIVKVTARVGDVFTIVRAQESTGPYAYSVDDFVQLRMTAATSNAVEAHLANTSNPHATTKAQVGLGNVDNTADADKPVSTAQSTALGLKYDKTGGTLTGNVTINTGVDSRVLLQTSGVTQGQFQTTATEVRLASNNTLPLLLSTNGVDRVTIDSAGNTVFGAAGASGSWKFQGNNAGDLVVIESTDTSATAAPDLVLFRNSASPVAGDQLGVLIWRGKDSGAADQQYARMGSELIDPTAGSEDADLWFETTVAGAAVERLRLNSYGVYVPNGVLGIGTATPARPIHIKTASGGAEMRFEATASGSLFSIGNHATDNAFIINDNTLSVERLRITSGGNGVFNGTWAATTFSGAGTSLTGTATNLTAGLATNISGGTTGDLLYQTAVGTTGKLAGVATGNVLLSGGVSLAPAYGKVGLTTHVSGTLPVANGGTGVTSSTGSGNVVLSTSPTLVTPVLGTPASGDLTNCTFPTLNQNTTGTAANVTGTVAPANGGTGITSYAVGDLVYASAATTLTKLPDVATGNVLLSGGVSTAPFYGKVGLSTHVSGTLGVGFGGTGLTGYAIGDLVYADTVNTLAKLADIATGNVLLSGGVGVAPSYGKVGLTTHVSGTLPVANGGTNSTATPTAGGIGYGTGTALAYTTAGVSGQALLSGAAGAPTWGTLGATAGGTGQTSYAIGDLLYASTTTAVSKLADVATGNVLLSGGVGVAPAYGKVGLTTHVSGTLPIANGGTNSTATPTNGGAAYGTGTAIAYTAAGTAGQVLVASGASAPAWSTLTLENVPDAAFKRSVKAGTTADLGASVFSAGVLTGFDDVVTLNVSTTASSTTATTTSTAGLKVGAVISGNPNIPAATTVASITNATTFVMSAQATVTVASVSTTFTQVIAALTVDGITLALNDRVLVKNQTAALQNGIYYLSTLGSTTVPWVLTRTLDADSASEIGGAIVNVDAGTTNGGTSFTTGFKTSDTLNTTAMNWYRVVDTGYTIPATQGGTGQTSYAVGDLLYASTTTAVSKLADVATGNALISGGVGVAPSYGKIGLTTHVSGTLAAGNGGTGQTTYAVGDILYADTTSSVNKLADVATGNALISGGVGVAPSYGKIGLTTHISGTLAVGNGGTGATTLTGLVKGNGTSAFTAAVAGTDYQSPIGTISGIVKGSGANALTAASGSDITTAIGATAVTNATNATHITGGTAGDLLYQSAAGATAKLADVATGNALISGGVGVAPSYGKIGLTTHISGTLAVGNGGTGVATLTGLAYGNGTGAFTAATAAQVVAVISTTAVTNATNATNATNVAIAADTTTASTFYIPYASATTGNVALQGTRLTVTPSTGDFTAAGNVTAYSDERLKTNWQDFDKDILSQLARVKTGVYDRTDVSSTQVGVSAQSLQAVMPNAVNTGEDGMLSVAYGNAALAAAVMLARKVEELEARLAKLEA